MKKAWQDPIGVIRDVAQGDPSMLYHPDIAALYSTDVPDDITNGATLVDGQWVNPPEPAPTPAPTPAPPVVPASITARQARLVLLQRGLLANVPLAIAQLPSPQKEEAKIEWEYATDFERSSPLLMGLGAALGWPPETLDEMFIEGAKL